MNHVKTAWMALAAGALLLFVNQGAQAQHMQQIPGANLTQLAVGSPWNIWGLNSAHQIFRFDAASHVFDLVPGSLVQIAVGGGNMEQPDAVWGVNSYGQIFQYSQSSWIRFAGQLNSISVGTGHGGCYPYEVWGINSLYEAWRFNFCSHGWEVGTGTFQSIVSSGGEVWAVATTTGNVYRFNFSTLSFNQVPGTANQIYLTGGSGTVFATRSVPLLHLFAVFWFDPSAQNWYSTPGGVHAFAAGGNEIWGLDGSGALLKYTPSTQAWTSYGGSYSQVAVGNGGGGVWTIDSSGRVYTLVTP